MIERLTMPLLLLHGTADRLTDPEGDVALQRDVESEDVTFRRYPDYFHDLLHEAHGIDVVGEGIRAWLDAHVAGKVADANPYDVVPTPVPDPFQKARGSDYFTDSDDERLTINPDGPGSLKIEARRTVEDRPVDEATYVFTPETASLGITKPRRLRITFTSVASGRFRSGQVVEAVVKFSKTARTVTVSWPDRETAYRDF